MSSSQTSSRMRNVLILLLSWSVIVVYGFALGVLRARQQGLGVDAAVHSVLPHLLRMLPGILVAFAVGLLVFLLVSRRPAGAGSPIEAGRVVWRRFRWISVGTAPFILIAAGVVLYHLAKGQWQDLDWFLAFFCVIYTAIVIAPWVQPPSSERLHALGTGDTSRLDDERAQQVLGKAANTTLGIFTIVLLTGGVLYETVVLGAWPVLTGAEFLVLGLIWMIAATYWNRRL